MLKNFSRAVHLTQDDNHLIINVLFKLSQVTPHLYFQLRADLIGQRWNQWQSRHNFIKRVE